MPETTKCGNCAECASCGHDRYKMGWDCECYPAPEPAPEPRECHDPVHATPCSANCRECIEECDPRYRTLPHPADCEFCLDA